MRLKDKVAVVTGGSSGIGRAIALRFAEEGAKVVVGDVREEPREGGKPTVEEINTTSPGAGLFVKCDVSKEEDVKRLVDEAVRNYGKLDVMANIAGVMIKRKAIEISAEELLRALSVNVAGVFYGCKWSIRQMLKQGEGGKVINMSSNLADVSLPEVSVYSASKAAVLALTKGLAVEYGPYGINVNALCPGATKTEFTRAFWETEEGLRDLRSRTPLVKRGEFLLQPRDIANAALFLASEESDRVTGECVLVDGGWNAW